MSARGRGGWHGDILYEFEDNGLGAAPSAVTEKVVGSNATLDTFEGSHNAARVFNHDRKAAEIARQVFEGAWAVGGELSEPPWWLQAIYGPPNSTETATIGLYEHDYGLSDTVDQGDPESLRFFLPTDGFTNYRVIPGAVIATLTVDQSTPGAPEFSMTGAYASEPFEASTETLSVPDLSKRTLQNRDATVDIGGTTLSRLQTHSLTVETGAEIITEIGAEDGVDWIPRAFEPNLSIEKIMHTNPDVDYLNRFKNFTESAIGIEWDNGETGTDQHQIKADLTASKPADWQEGGRNDPDVNLTEEMTEWPLDVTWTLTNDTATPP